MGEELRRVPEVKEEEEKPVPQTIYAGFCAILYVTMWKWFICRSAAKRHAQNEAEIVQNVFTNWAEPQRRGLFSEL